MSKCYPKSYVRMCSARMTSTRGVAWQQSFPHHDGLFGALLPVLSHAGLGLLSGRSQRLAGFGITRKCMTSIGGSLAGLMTARVLAVPASAHMTETRSCRAGLPFDSSRRQTSARQQRPGLPMCIGSRQRISQRGFRQRLCCQAAGQPDLWRWVRPGVSRGAFRGILEERPMHARYAGAHQRKKWLAKA